MAAPALPTLTYFAGRGLGEIPRLLLAEAGVQYTDRRLEKIDEIKATLPFGQVPLWEEPNGFKLVQSGSISRHIARTHNLYGKGEHQAAHIDQWVDAITDLRTAVRNAKTDEEKAKVKAEVIPKWLGYFEALAKPHVEKHHFVVGEQVSWADIALYYALDWLNTEHAGILATYPTLTTVHKTIGERPKIAHWVKTRPVTPW